MPTPPSPDHLSTIEAARILGLKPQSMRLWIHHGNSPIPFVKDGRWVWWPREGVDFLTSPTVPEPCDLKVSRALATFKTSAPIDAIARRSGMSVDGVRRHLRSLRARSIVRISGWERRPPGEWGGAKPVYAMGDAPDVKKPNRMKKGRTQKRWRQSNPEMVRREYWRRKARGFKVRMDPLLALFMKLGRGATASGHRDA